MITFLYPNCLYQYKFHIARPLESLFLAHDIIVLNKPNPECECGLWGRAGWISTRQAPPLHRPGWDIFGLPLPTRVRVPPALIPWIGTRLSPSIFIGDLFGGWAGRGPGGDQRSEWLAEDSTGLASQVESQV